MLTLHFRGHAGSFLRRLIGRSRKSLSESSQSNAPTEKLVSAMGPFLQPVTDFEKLVTKQNRRETVDSR